MGRQARPARVARRDPRQGLPGEDGAGNCRFLGLGRRESFRTFEQVPKRKDLRTCAACNLKESLPFCDFSKSARLPLAPRRNLREPFPGKVRLFSLRTFGQVPKRKDLRTCAACNLKESPPFCDFSKSARLPLAPRRNLRESSPVFLSDFRASPEEEGLADLRSLQSKRVSSFL